MVASTAEKVKSRAKGGTAVSELTSSFVHLTQMSRRLDIFFVSAVGQYPSTWLHTMRDFSSGTGTASPGVITAVYAFRPLLAAQSEQHYKE